MHTLPNNYFHLGFKIVIMRKNYIWFVNVYTKIKFKQLVAYQGLVYLVLI